MMKGIMSSLNYQLRMCNGIISGYLSFKNKFMDAYNNLLNEPDLPGEVIDDEEEDDNKIIKRYDRVIY